ncbi:MAG: tol-pal system protein YbgF [Betaproteobacteria bacterium]
MIIHAFRRKLASIGGAGLIAALALAAALPVQAALFDDTEARQRIEATNQRLDQIRRQIEDRIAALEQQIKNQGLVDIFNQIEQLKSDVARLRGQLEVITFELSEAQKRQRDLYVDLDSRMRRLEAAGAAAPGPAAGDIPGASGSTARPALPGGGFGPPPGAGSAPAPAAVIAPRAPEGAGDANAEQRAYDAALDQFKSGNYGAAVTGFAGFVRSYPRSPLAPSAQYWIGNAQFAQRDFRGAIASQRQLITAYPESQKVPDAMLNVASSQFELGDTTQSRRTLEDLIARYPQSEAAAKARQRLAIR